MGFIQIPEIDETLGIYNIDMYKALSDVTTAEQKRKFKEQMSKNLQESELENEIDEDGSDFAENIEAENYNVTEKQSSYDLWSRTNLLIHTNVNKTIRGIQVSHITEKYNVDSRDKSSLNQKLLFVTIRVKDMSCR